LNRKYSATMLAQNEFSSAAFDSSAVFDIQAGDWTLHHQSGPMQPDQLHANYLRFPLDDPPPHFLFLEASIVDGNVVQYAERDTQTFLSKSLELCSAHMALFQQIWEAQQ